MPRRIEVEFSEEVYAQLQLIAKERGMTVAQVLRDALGLEKYAADTWREGGRLYVEKRNGDTRELLAR